MRKTAKISSLALIVFCSVLIGFWLGVNLADGQWEAGMQAFLEKLESKGYVLLKVPPGQEVRFRPVLSGRIEWPEESK